VELLGEGNFRAADPSAWVALEERLGFGLPTDFKQLVDAYAPAVINKDLHLRHPATEMWNLGEDIEQSVRAFSDVPWEEEDELTCDPSELLGLSEMRFGTADGLLPVTYATYGGTVFLAPGVPPARWRVIVHSDLDFHEYRMGFGEWFRRYLSGEDAFGPDSAVPRSGLPELELLPTRRADREGR
jgi:hypothetical protein